MKQFELSVVTSNLEFEKFPVTSKMLRSGLLGSGTHAFAIVVDCAWVKKLKKKKKKTSTKINTTLRFLLHIFFD